MQTNEICETDVARQSEKSDRDLLAQASSCRRRASCQDAVGLRHDFSLRFDIYTVPVPRTQCTLRVQSTLASVLVSRCIATSHGTEQSVPSRLAPLAWSLTTTR